MTIEIFRKIDNGVDRVATWGLVATVIGMLLFSVLTIVLRWFNTSIMWFDPLVRHLVFLSAFLGGVIATGRGTHIAIDILGKFFETHHKHHLKKIHFQCTAFISMAVIFWLTKASWDFMIVEFQYGKIEFLGIHSGVLVGIIPVGLFLIGVRFFCLMICSFSKDKKIFVEQ